MRKFWTIGILAVAMLFLVAGALLFALGFQAGRSATDWAMASGRLHAMPVEERVQKYPILAFLGAFEPAGEDYREEADAILRTIRIAKLTGLVLLLIGVGGGFLGMGRWFQGVEPKSS